MKTPVLCLLTISAVNCFAQNNFASLFQFNGEKINNSSCYNATPLVPTQVKKESVLFQSTDGGTTWTDIGIELPKGIEVSRCFETNGEIYVGTFDGRIYHCSDAHNKLWELQEFQNKKSKGFVTGIFPGKSGNYSTIYQEGIFKQVSGTRVWKPISDNLGDKDIFALLELEDGSIMVGGSNGIHLTTDDGNSWKHVYTESWVNSLTLQNNIFLTSAAMGVFRSSDNGNTWDCVIRETGGMHKTLVIDGYFVIVHGGGSKVSISADGIAWKPLDAGKPADQVIYDINKSGEYLFSSRKAGVSRSNDMGKTWQLILATPAEFEKENMYCEMVVSGSSIFIMVKKGC